MVFMGTGLLPNQTQPAELGQHSASSWACLPTSPSQPSVDTEHATSLPCPWAAVHFREQKGPPSLTVSQALTGLSLHAFVHAKQELSKAKKPTCIAESGKSNRPHAHQNNADNHSHLIFAQGFKVSKLLQLQSHGIRTKERSYRPPTSSPRISLIPGTHCIAPPSWWPLHHS